MIERRTLTRDWSGVRPEKAGHIPPQHVAVHVLPERLYRVGWGRKPHRLFQGVFEHPLAHVFLEIYCPSRFEHSGVALPAWRAKNEDVQLGAWTRLLDDLVNSPNFAPLFKSRPRAVREAQRELMQDLGYAVKDLVERARLRMAPTFRDDAWALAV